MTIGYRHPVTAWALVAVALALASLSLTACSPQKTEDQPAATPAPAVGDETRTPAVTPAVPAPVAATPVEGATLGGDGSRIQLSGLTLADQQAHDLKGELSCYFHDKANALLLVGSGFSGVKEPGYGLVKVLDSVEQVVAPGGFDAMVNGTAFSGQGKTVTIAITGPSTGGGESPPYPATLTYDRADGAKRVFVGTWTCGP